MDNVFDFNTAPRLTPAPQRIDADEITRALKLRIRDYVTRLFPRIAIRRGEGRIGSLNGEPGESLSITLEGPDAGLWIDHATGESGNLIQLWEQAEGVGFTEACDQLAAWLGWSDRTFQPSTKAKARAQQPERQDEPLGAPSGAWNYLDKDGIIIATVYRYERDGKKTYRPYDATTKRHAPPEGLRPLYNIPALLNAEKVILCEGEKTADAINAAGFTATTMMSGAKAPPEKTDFSPILGKQITLWRDNDQAGVQWQEELTAYLRGLGCVLSAVEPPHGKPDRWDAADTDADEIRAILGAVTAPKSRFQFRKADALKKAPPPSFLLDNFIIENTFACLYGPSGAGKSFVAIDIALAIAHGKPWQGHNVKQSTVAYIAGEGAGGFGARIAAWDQKHSLDTETAPFHFLGEAVNLLDPKQDMADLYAALDNINPGLVIIDTLARAFAGGDENTAKDMMAFVANCGAIQARYNCTVLVIHHSGKDAEKGARGSSAFRAALDTEIQITKIEGMTNITLKTTKQKDAEEAPPIRLRLQQIECTVGPDGEVKKSCVVMEDEGLFADRRQKLSPKQVAVIQLLENINGATIREISDTTEVAYSTVEDILKKLQELGFAEVIPETRPAIFRRKQPS